MIKEKRDFRPKDQNIEMQEKLKRYRKEYRPLLDPDIPYTERDPDRWNKGMALLGKIERVEDFLGSRYGE